MYQAYRKCEKALLVAIEWGQKWVENYIYDPLKHVVQRIVKIIKRAVNKVRQVVRGRIFTGVNNIDWNGFAPIEGNQFYLIDLLDDNGDLIWPKIGTTTRYTCERFKEHITPSKQSTSYSEHGISKIKVRGLWDCGDIDPVEVESKVRSYLKRKYGEENYIKNDRFAIPIDYEDLINKIPTLIKNLQLAEIA